MKILHVVMVLVGLLPLGVVLLRMRSTRRMIETGVKTQGVVREVRGRTNPDMGSIVLEYRVEGTGQAIAKVVATGGTVYEVGQRVPLIYAADDPQRMMLGWTSSWWVLLILAGVFAAFMVGLCFRV